MVSAFGALLAYYAPEYEKAGYSYNTIENLVSYSNLFMGFGNLIFVPLAMAIGRRPVFLLNSILAILGGVLASQAKTFDWHMGARMLIGLSAGIGEALMPQIVSVRTCLPLVPNIGTTR